MYHILLLSSPIYQGVTALVRRRKSGSFLAHYVQEQTALHLGNILNKGINDAWNSIYSVLGSSEVRCLAVIRRSHFDQFSTDYYYYPLSTSQLGILLFNNQTPYNFNKENNATSPLANN